MSVFDIGMLVQLTKGENPFTKLAELGFVTCQLCCWQPELYTKEVADQVNKQVKDADVYIAAVWAGWTGPADWNFIDGPSTLGIVPPEYRQMRISQIKKGADFAQMIGAPAIVTHLGFLPENPKEPIYGTVVETVRDIAQYCSERELSFWFETGQETPVTLLRLIEDVDLPNLGINLDTANLILYGKANPVDALDVFGKYVRNLHAKDGLYPQNGRELGSEVPLGQGKTNLPEVLKRLKEFGFDGQIIIEREITGPKQIQDIIAAKKYLESILHDQGLN